MAFAEADSSGVLWVEYGAAGQAALGHTAYLDALDGSDFALAPPGWGHWTHRLPEALIRHSIPIAEAGECRALGLVDGATAVFVEGCDWTGAVRRALAMTPDEIVAARRAIAVFARAVLSPEAAYRRMIRALRLAD